MPHSISSKAVLGTLLAAMAVILGACSSADEEDMYPSLISEFGIVYTDADTCIWQFDTDGGSTYRLASPIRLSGADPDARYRGIVRYVTEAAGGAQLRGFQGTPLLHDSTAVAQTDPTGIESVWMGRDFINLRLTPRTQGGQQYWGYAIDSVSTDSTHYHLRLHHSQQNDPTSYTATLYASIDARRLPSYHQGDTITLHINTFNGLRTWKLTR